MCGLNKRKVSDLPRHTRIFIYQHLSAVFPLCFLAGYIVRPGGLRSGRSPATQPPPIGTIHLYVDVRNDLNVSRVLARTIRTLRYV